MLDDEPLSRCAMWCNREVAQQRRDREVPGRGLVRLRPANEGDLDLLAGWFGDPSFIDRWGQTLLTRQEVAAKYVGRRRPDAESFIILAGDVRGRHRPDPRPALAGTGLRA
ncbi:hypothetical protein AB0H83_49865 [Dactylosporangium sp. NPDC050688]|uniref:hypothetical protein n=1 Tax=Dactylosporangium sp. NPDC050688 TaxID=3157217 RepID=UPI0034116112